MNIFLFLAFIPLFAYDFLKVFSIKNEQRVSKRFSYRGTKLYPGNSVEVGMKVSGQEYKAGE